MPSSGSRGSGIRLGAFLCGFRKRAGGEAGNSEGALAEQRLYDQGNGPEQRVFIAAAGIGEEKSVMDVDQEIPHPGGRLPSGWRRCGRRRRG